MAGHAQVLVGRHGLAVLEPEGLEAQAGGARPAPGRHQQLVRGQRLAARQRQADLAVGPLGALHLGARAHVDAALGQRGGDLLGDEGLLAGQQAVGHLDDRHARAQPAPRVGQLHARDAAAEHEQPARHRARRRGLPRGPVTASSRPSTGGSVAALPVASTTARPASSTSSPTRTRRSPSRTPLPRTSSMPRFSSHGSCSASSKWWTTSSRRRSAATRVERPRHRLRGARHTPRLRRDLRRTQQRLRGHARPVRALAAHELAFHDRHLAAHRRPGGRPPPRPPGPRPARSRRRSASPWRGSVALLECRTCSRTTTSTCARTSRARRPSVTSPRTTPSATASWRPSAASPSSA